ncbi:MAG: hypothetical protein ABSE73_19270 [Planctomycetota bacterium]
MTEAPKKRPWSQYDFSNAVNAMLLPAALLVLTGLMVYKCRSTPFYEYDDKQHVLPAVERDCADYFRLRFETFFPVTQLSYRLDYLLFGPQPAEAEQCFTFKAGGDAGAPTGATSGPALKWAAGIRLMSGLYHFLAGVLLWLALTRLGAPLGLAAFVALVWTGQPMACESVCWIAERKNVLAALFCFGALLAWTAAPQRRWRWPLVWLLYALALLSKPSALGFLPVFFALEFLSSGAACQVAGAIRRIALHPPERHALLCARTWVGLAGRLTVPVLLAAGAVWAGYRGHQLELVDPPGGTVWTALLTDTWIVAQYVSHILLPVGLSFFYGVQPIVSLGDARLWCCALVLAAFFAFILWAAGKEQRRLAVLGILWFFCALAPNANLVALAYWMQDRYAYLATAGLALAVAAAGLGLCRRFPRAGPWLQGAACLYTLFLAMLLADRAALFSAEDQLILAAAEAEPLSAKARLVAAELHRQSYERHWRNGPEPNPELARQSAQATVANYLGALECPDLQNFRDRLTLRTALATVLMNIGELARACEALEQLPPQDLPLLPETTPQGDRITYARGAEHRGYTAERLSEAYARRAEINFRASCSPALPPERQSELRRQALEDILEARRTHLRQHWNDVDYAWILLRLSRLEQSGGQPEESRRHYDEAVAILKQVPESSPAFRSAQRILAQEQTGVSH